MSSWSPIKINGLTPLYEKTQCKKGLGIIENIIYVLIYQKIHTSLLRADAADPRSAGSIERRVSMSAKAGAGKSLNVSATQRL